MKSYRFVFLALLAPSVASAHIGIPSGPAQANVTNQKITFAINHGCHALAPSTATYDTLSVQIDIPTVGIDRTTVRAMANDLSSSPVVVWEGTGTTATAKSVTWTRKPTDVLQDGTSPYYEVTIKAKVADVPFTKIPFVIKQVCRPAAGNPNGADDITVTWTGPSTNAEPSPELLVVPKHVTGWNKLTLATALPATEFKVYFADAQIVWKGTAAYSQQEAIAPLITTTPGVSALGDLAAGDEIWVKY